jgi:hypothetical protein
MRMASASAFLPCWRSEFARLFMLASVLGCSLPSTGFEVYYMYFVTILAICSHDWGNDCRSLDLYVNQEFHISATCLCKLMSLFNKSTLPSSRVRPFALSCRSHSSLRESEYMGRGPLYSQSYYITNIYVDVLWMSL